MSCVAKGSGGQILTFDRLPPAYSGRLRFVTGIHSGFLKILSPAARNRFSTQFARVRTRRQKCQRKVSVEDKRVSNQRVDLFFCPRVPSLPRSGEGGRQAGFGLSARESAVPVVSENGNGTAPQSRMLRGGYSFGATSLFALRAKADRSEWR